MLLENADTSSSFLILTGCSVSSLSLAGRSASGDRRGGDDFDSDNIEQAGLPIEDSDGHAAFESEMKSDQEYDSIPFGKAPV